MTSVAPTHGLTVEQQALVALPVDAMVLVTAGPGAGKTHTLVRRVERLAQEHDLRSHDILVLTFSRSAVRELRGRLTSMGDAGGALRAQTFDSWALDVLVEVDGQRDWSAAGFDQRVRAAAEAIRKGLTDDRHEGLRHVVVDEIQDLVGDRRELVQALLTRFDCGFTLVGDPAQSIYGFQSPGEENGRFIGWVREEFGDGLVELSLTENFRVRRQEARIALDFGRRLQIPVADEATTSDVYEGLRTALMSTLDLGEPTDRIALKALSEPEVSTAVLCRTNGEALLVSEALWGAGLSHRHQPAAQERLAPTWVAALLNGEPRRDIDRTRLEQALDAHGRTADAELMWRALVRVAGGAGRRIDHTELRQALAQGRLPDEIVARPHSNLIVSSFHRAKGLEFDRVVVVDPGPLVRQGAEVAEEARLLYVAMTRPRDDLWRAQSRKTWDVRLNERTDRWARFGRRSWEHRGVEVRAGDVHTDDPAGTVGFIRDPAGLQRVLSARVQPGDEVVLERLHEESLQGAMSPPYAVRHAEGPIGVASERFRSALFRVLQTSARSRPRTFPRRIESLRIAAVVSVAGSEAAGARADLGDTGVWIAPSVAGLGRFVFEHGGTDRG